MKKQISKKLKLSIAIILIFLLAFIIITNSSYYKINKGNKLFKNYYCEGHGMYVPTGEWISNAKCKICNHKIKYPTNYDPTLCSTCAKITNRCVKCGNLLSE